VTSEGLRMTGEGLRMTGLEAFFSILLEQAAGIGFAECTAIHRDKISISVETRPDPSGRYALVPEPLDSRCAIG